MILAQGRRWVVLGMIVGVVGASCAELAGPAASPSGAGDGGTRATAAPSTTAARALAPAVPTEAASLPPPPPPPPKPTSAKATTKTDPAWAQCHRGYEAKGKDVTKDVDAMAQACAKVTHLKLFGKPLSGKQSDQDPPQTFPLKAEANHCYRVYAQGSEGIRDLDVAINDSTGAMAGEDDTDDASPVLLDDGMVCFKEADDAVLIVSVGLGKGTYAVEIWRD